MASKALSKDRRASDEARGAAADEFTRGIAPLIQSLQTKRITGLCAVSRGLSARKVETRRGGSWTPFKVGDLFKRLERIKVCRKRPAITLSCDPR